MKFAIVTCFLGPANSMYRSLVLTWQVRLSNRFLNSASYLLTIMILAWASDKLSSFSVTSSFSVSLFSIFAFNSSTSCLYPMISSRTIRPGSALSIVRQRSGSILMHVGRGNISSGFSRSREVNSNRLEVKKKVNYKQVLIEIYSISLSNFVTLNGL